MSELTTSDVAWDEFVRSHSTGDLVQGTVLEVTDRAAAVDLGGIRGRIDIQNVTWGHGPLFPAVGTRGHFVIFGIDQPARVIALSSLVPNGERWAMIEEKYPAGSRHSGEVVNLMTYGAFVMLEPGVEGLLPHPALQSQGEAGSPPVMPSMGQSLDVVVQSVSRERREIILGLA